MPRSVAQTCRRGNSRLIEAQSPVSPPQTNGDIFRAVMASIAVMLRSRPCESDEPGRSTPRPARTD